MKAVAAAGASRTSGRADDAAGALRVCFVGDSITTGVGDGRWLGWPIRLCAREGADGRDVTPYSLGVRGDCSEDVRRRWRQECTLRLPPECPGGIVFAFGINDTCDRGGRRRVSLRRSIANAKAVVASAAAWRPTLWIGPPCVSAARTPWRVTTNGVVHEFRNERIAELSNAFATIARDRGVPYLDLCRSLASSAGWGASLARGDGVHPDARGHARLASIVGGWTAWRALVGHPWNSRGASGIQSYRCVQPNGHQPTC